MTTVSLSIGSNIDAERHISRALDSLRDKFGDMEVSTVYESEAVGFHGDNFLNLVVIIQTRMPLAELESYLKDMEERHGRVRPSQSLGSDGDRPAPFIARTLDVDILTYGELTGEHDGIRLPRPEITQNAYVLRPLAEIWGSRTVPGSGRTFGQLWQDYDKDSQKLWPVDFDRGPR